MTANRAQPLHHPRASVRTGLLLLATTLHAGCSYLPDREQVTLAATEAIRDPRVWSPLLGAAGLQIDNADRRISSWARRETPLFGSQDSAQRWSDELRSVAVVSDAVTVLAMPVPADGSGWALEKAGSYLVDLAAATAAIGATHVLKDTTHRLRPSGQDDQSMPSGHATTASAYDRLAQINLQQTGMDPAAEQALGYGLDAVTFATAWARIEAGAHYPSDTLVGIAIGNFSARFFTSAFGRDPYTKLTLAPTAQGMGLRWSTRF